MDQPLWQRLRDESIAVPGRARIHAAEHRMIYEAIVERRPRRRRLLRHPAHRARAALHDPRLGETTCASPASSPPSRPRSAPTARSTPRRCRPTSRALLDAGVHGIVGHRHDGRGRQPEHAPSAARSSRPSPGRRRPRAGDRGRLRGHRRAGAVAYAADAARRPGRDAIMLPAAAGLPRPTSASSSPSTAPSARATGLPLMAYNNPEAERRRHAARR